MASGRTGRGQAPFRAFAGARLEVAGCKQVRDAVENAHPGMDDLDMPTHHLRSRIAITLAALALVAGPALAQEAPRSPTPSSSPTPARLTEVARGLEHPWGLAFLPDGRMLVTERPGRLRIVGRDGRLSTSLTGVPDVLARGQGGLLDVALSPGFAQDRLVYLSFSEPGPDGGGTAVARGRLGEGGLDGTQVIWRQEPKVSGNNHWGSRLVFRSDGTLFVTLGDRFGQRDRAQDLAVTIGKIVRHQCRRLGPARQPLRRPQRRTSRDLVVWSPQRSERRARRTRPALDGGAWRPRW